MKFFSELYKAILVLAMGFILLNPTAGHTQDQQGDQGTLLPEIDPQDIEIRSKFKARFPGLRRQPILGFNPTPRVYQIDPNRQPFMETRDQVVANLPVSNLARPAAPGFTPLGYNPDINGYGRLGIGSYISPEADFWGVYELSDRSYGGAMLNYRSSDSHLDNQPSSFRFLDSELMYVAGLDNDYKLKVDASLQSDFNYLVDQTTTPGSFSNQFPKKNYLGGSIGAELRRFRNTVEGWSVQANYRYFNTELQSPVIPGNRTESIVNGSATYRWAGNHIQETFAVNLGGRAGVQGSWSTLQGGGIYERLFDYSTQLTAEANIYYTTNSFEDKFYFSPAVQLKHWITESLTVTGNFSGRPYLKSMEKHQEANRFLGYQDLLRHTFTYEGRGEMAFEYYKGSTIHIGITYQNAQNYAYYSKTVSTGNAVPAPIGTVDLYAINYMDAERIKGYAGLSHQLVPEKLWVNAEGYLQNPELANGQDIPFEETWGINSSLSYRPVDRLTIEASADYVGSRESFTPAGRLDGFLLIGSRVEIGITDRIGAYARINNLLNQDYQIWQGYTERPLQVYGGISIKLK